MRPDISQAIYIGTKHLIERGHRKIGLLTREEYAPSHSKEKPFTFGYANAMTENGIKPHIINIPTDNFKENKFSMYRTGEEMAEKVFHAKEISALVCEDSLVCFALVNKAKEYGVRIPDDLALLGYFNWDCCSVSRPSISVVDVPPYDLGWNAAEMMIDLIKGKEIPDRLVPPVLIPREST